MNRKWTLLGFILLCGCASQRNEIPQNGQAELGEQVNSAVRSLATSITSHGQVDTTSASATNGLSLLLQDMKKTSQLSSLSIQDSYLNRCLYPSGDFSDYDGDGIPAAGHYQISCAYGTSPYRNWIVYNGSYDIQDSNNWDRNSGWNEHYNSVYATYYDDYGNATTYLLNTNQTISQNSAGNYSMNYWETSGPLSNRVQYTNSGSFVSQNANDPYGGGTVNTTGVVNTPIGSSQITAQGNAKSNMKMKDVVITRACQGAVSGQVIVANTVLNYSGCNRYTIGQVN